MLDRIAAMGMGDLLELDQWLHALIAEKDAENTLWLANRESSHDRGPSYQHEYVKCGKAGCKCASGQGHGPYWYAYWTDALGKTRKKYIGKNLPTKGSSTVK